MPKRSGNKNYKLHTNHPKHLDILDPVIPQSINVVALAQIQSVRKIADVRKFKLSYGFYDVHSSNSMANPTIPFTQHSHSKSGYVLIADDRPLNRLMVRDLLESAGHRVVEAENGQEALEIVEAEALDLVLLDIMMPLLDGFEVCERIKAHEETRLLPVMVMTGLNDKKSRVRGIEAGADDFLSKPLDSAELIARAQSLIHKKRLNDDLDNAAEALMAIAQAVESRDRTTGDHCKRLSHMGRDFGAELNLPPSHIKALEWAGYLHDIGKIGIPDSILGKPGKHTPEEQAIMQTHAEIGERICQPLRTMKHVLPIIRHHHERWDGTGYPDGLKGEEIPFLARVFQTIDIYDALTSERPYKPAFTPEKAIEIMLDETQRGWQDPELTEQFHQYLKQRWNFSHPKETYFPVQSTVLAS